MNNKIWKNNNTLLKESLGQDYSYIPEVKSLGYKEPVRRSGFFLPGITYMKQFVKALEDTGYNKFKIRSSRCPVSEADLKDSWMDLHRHGWDWSKDWDTSLEGFNEVYIFNKR